VAAPGDRHLQDAPVWANLFCFDEAASRPDRRTDDSTAAIVRLSGALLRIQIEVLQPDLIVFATGSSCDGYLKEHFRILGSTVHVPREIWEFKLPLLADVETQGHVRAFRTPHPRHGATARARAAIVADALDPGALAAYLRTGASPAAMASLTRDDT